MYAGFWRRFAAYLIDSLLLSIVIYIIAFFLIMVTGISSTIASSNDGSLIGMLSAFSGLFFIMGLLLPWLYFALMESSGKQATLGKMALGIKVIGYDGGRISFGRATGRYFAKILSGLILSIGYIMAAFTARKQALHDMIAETFVVDKNFEGSPKPV